MSIRPDNGPFVQEMPPEGGYKKIDFTRRLPDRGPKGWQLWAGSSLMIMYGFYKIGETNKEKNMNKLHERRARYTLAPYLQAESDREYVERELAILAKENEVMKEFKDWSAISKPMHGDKWLPRAAGELSRHTK